MKWGDLISVIVPVYNLENYIEKCIESILGQTYTFLEIIIVDDGSFDRSAEICDEYERTDSRVTVIHKKNGGQVSARKEGARKATGKYILNVDGDDWIDSKRIEKVVRTIIETNAEVIYLDGFWKEYKNNNELHINHFEEKVYYSSQIVKELVPLLASADECFHRELEPSNCFLAIERTLYVRVQLEICDDISQGEDHIFTWFVLLEASTVARCKESGYHYVQRSESITHIANEFQMQDLQRVFSRIKNKMKEKSCLECINILVFFIFRDIFITDYSCIFRMNRNYLFPYPQVKINSKIVLYGAGAVGRRMHSVLEQSDQYHIVMWVDQGKENTEVDGNNIFGISTIKKVDFDYIVIAIVDSKVAQKIKAMLFEAGIPEKVIATMNNCVISEDELPRDFLRETGLLN